MCHCGLLALNRLWCGSTSHPEGGCQVLLYNTCHDYLQNKGKQKRMLVERTVNSVLGYKGPTAWDSRGLPLLVPFHYDKIVLLLCVCTHDHVHLWIPMLVYACLGQRTAWSERLSLHCMLQGQSPGCLSYVARSCSPLSHLQALQQVFGKSLSHHFILKLPCAWKTDSPVPFLSHVTGSF